ncbi:MAG: metal ABC transporter permease, partial [Deltaproteobacteria bacterium]|nr:metal ABC transporter permease [Deltaproteobacteria bacterium]
MLFGVASGVLGSFALLRRRALLGDAIAHAALPGICIAYLLTRLKHPAVVIAGALASGLLGSFLVNFISRKSRIKEDTAIGLVLSVFFGIGILLLTYIQHQPLGNQSGLDKFLFGQAASMVADDVMVFGGVAFFLMIVVFFLYKELKVLAFDREFASAIGLPTGLIDALLTVLIVLTVTVGLQAVGVVLMAAMLITPAAAARQWTDDLPLMLVLSGIFGAVAGASGTLASTLAPRMPTGPWIVVVVTTIFAISIVFAPNRGWLVRSLRHRRNSQKINSENILLTLYRVAEQSVESCSLDLLRRYRYLSVRHAVNLLQHLESRGWVSKASLPDHWSLTQQGFDEAKRLIRRHRLWELYLSRYLHLSKGQVHADAEEIEHILTPELERELDALLGT